MDKFVEEKFDLLHYPEATQHIEAHKLYKERINSLYLELDKPKPDMQTIADEIATFAINFLTEHILLMDLKYSVFFIEHGVR